MTEKHTVHWFRKGLRLHDNPSLRQGLEGATTFRCIFILDPFFAGASNVGVNKWRFLLQCLEDLDCSLRKLNSRLFVIKGQPADILPKLLKEWGTTCLSFEEDPEPFGRVRDQNIIAMCKSMNITVITSVTHTLYKLEMIIEKNGGKAPLTYHQFQAIVSSMDPPPLPEPTVSAASIGSTISIIADDHDEKYGIPTLEELGSGSQRKTVSSLWPGVSINIKPDSNGAVNWATAGLKRLSISIGALYLHQSIRSKSNVLLDYILCETDEPELLTESVGYSCANISGFDTETLLPGVWQGGESEALSRLERHLERKAWVASFGGPKMTPQSLLPSQTCLSPYLRFGCLSTRLFYYQLNELYKKIKKALPPLSLHGQILWREFFYCAATRNPNFDKMIGNPICVQVPWDHNPEALAKWANGQTGFPWIDAIMTQLREEGWIHHIARHAVACFLTRGDLWISWEEGMKVFDELLLDADWSVNAGMWMWLSCSSFFQQFFHCYCPVRFGRKADPNGDYIRKYLPVLKNMPTKYIHEPWNCPESVQKVAKCAIGIDYPLPMLNHNVVARHNIERMKQVYQQLIKYRGTGLTSILGATPLRSTEKEKNEISNNFENIFAAPLLPANK